MLWSGGGSGAGVVANTCSAGDFFSAVDGSGNFTCSTPAFSDLSGSATDAQIPNNITVDLATLATTATTANAGDSATSFFSTGELERTLLPAASADCSASNWAKGVDADFVLDCAQPAFTDISGSVTDAQVPNNITVDLATLATTATTANAGDSATSFFSSGELERTLLPAASGDCSSNQFAKGIDADLVLDCAQPAFTDISGSVTDAQVPDTITASNYLPLAGGTMTGNLVLSGDAGEGLSGGGLSDCDNATTSKLLWDTSTNKFSCGTDQSGSGGGGWTYDIVADYGAACDGSTDDSGALQDCIDDANTAGGGTCFVPATGTACVINADVVPKSNANLFCEPGAILRSGGSLTSGMLYTTSAVTGVSIQNCVFNADQVKKHVVYMSSTDNTEVAVLNNRFYWNYDADGASTNSTALDYLYLGCAAYPTALDGGCKVVGNTIIGSDTDAQNDRGIAVTGGGGLVGFGSNFIVSGNDVEFTGGDCIGVPTGTFAGRINGNAMYSCNGAGIKGQIVQSLIDGNMIYVDTSNGTYAMDLGTTATNNRIIGNNLPSNGGKGAIYMVQGSGTQVSNNYVAGGVFYTQSTATTATSHPTVTGNIFSAAQCGDDPSDGGTLRACIYVDNPEWAVIADNAVVSGFGTNGGNAIRLYLKDTTSGSDMPDIQITGNVLALDADATGSESCIEFYDASGSADNGFETVVIANNICGVEGDAQSVDECVDIDNISEDSNWDKITYSANEFSRCTTFQSGGTTTNVTPQLRNTGSGFTWEPRGANDGFGFRSIHMMGDGNCVPAAGTGYLGPISTSGNNCSATETSVDWSVGLNPVTFTNMTCRQNEDTTCTVVFTLRDDASNTSATCTTTNNDTCAWNGTVTMAASSMAAISMTTNTSCATESNVECDLTYTVD